MNIAIPTPRMDGPEQPVVQQQVRGCLSQDLALLQGVVMSMQSHASHGSWRWAVRQAMTPVRDGLMNDSGYQSDWLEARRDMILRERSALLHEMSDLARRVLHHEDLAQLESELTRLVGDLRHHVQRINDLAYDEVELELGGSE